MFFNSIDFAVFLPVVFLLHWILSCKGVSSQNLLLLCASYFFYACWDWRFLFLLMFSTLLDYYSGIRIGAAKGSYARKGWLWASIVINIGFLAIFKYYNFFIVTFAEALSLAGLPANFTSLEIILPVGISFYTFHGISYVIDIYNRRVVPEKQFVTYALFVSFFPLLVAGPIERATHLLPQIKIKRVFDYNKAVDGLRQILWGLFKKVVIADWCAKYANVLFDNPGNYHSSTLVLGVVFFALQIYCDFSGYSDIALGTARLFGIDLLRNFAFPYFSRDIAEFWRRWHISLSSWFRDYLYIPLGGSKGGTLMRVRNTFIIFIVSGFWHGSNWTFIAWGFLHAIYFLPLLLLNKNRNNVEIVAQGKIFPTVRELISMLGTFGLVCFAWIFFRAASIHQAFDYIHRIFSKTLFTLPQLAPLSLFVMIIFFVLVEWAGREQKYALATLGISWPKPVRWGFYYLIAFSIFWFSGRQQPFIYFQF